VFAFVSLRFQLSDKQRTIEEKCEFLLARLIAHYAGMRRPTFTSQEWSVPAARFFSEGCRMQDKLNFYGCIPAVVSGNESFRSLAFTVQVNTTTTKLFIVYVCTVAETIIQPSDTVCMKSHKNAYRVVADGSSMRGFYKTRKTLFGKFFFEFSEV
jgi:hypothetical protein